MGPSGALPSAQGSGASAAVSGGARHEVAPRGDERVPGTVARAADEDEDEDDEDEEDEGAEPADAQEQMARVRSLADGARAPPACCHTSPARAGHVARHVRP